MRNPQKCCFFFMVRHVLQPMISFHFASSARYPHPRSHSSMLRCSRMARASDAEFAVLMHKIMELPVAVFQSFIKFIWWAVAKGIVIIYTWNMWKWWKQHHCRRVHVVVTLQERRYFLFNHGAKSPSLVWSQCSLHWISAGEHDTTRNIWKNISSHLYTFVVSGRNRKFMCHNFIRMLLFDTFLSSWRSLYPMRCQ